MEIFVKGFWEREVQWGGASLENYWGVVVSEVEDEREYERG